MKNKKYKTLICGMLLALSLTSFGKEEIIKTDIDDTQFLKVYDPWENFNRRSYAFNYYFDRYFFSPVVQTYSFFTPDLVQTGVKNFYSNSKNIQTLANSAAQLKFRKFMRTLGRFSMNSILGAFGVIDVATKLDMPSDYEDFGLTLSHYGVGDGPYVVVPFLGPSNLRDAFGNGLGTVLIPEIHPYTTMGAVDISNLEIRALDAVNTRKQVTFKYYGTGSPFEYEYLRFFYKEFRDIQENLD
ncbi:MAG: MlaA family lipoprotein [Fusobacteriaceae bacterium]